MASFYKELAQLQKGAPDIKNAINSGGEATKRLVGVLYGHNGSGKIYNYLAGPNVRAGDYVTPEVTHAKGSHPTYRTLAKVIYTQDSRGEAAQNVEGILDGKLKILGSTDQRSLPGFKTQKAKYPDFTTKQWKIEGDIRHQERIDRILSNRKTQDNTEAAKRILGG